MKVQAPIDAPANNLPTLHYRTITVTGRIENTRTGLQIVLPDASGIIVHPVESGLALQEAPRELEGWELRYTAAVRELLTQGKFEELENIADRLRKERTRWPV